MTSNLVWRAALSILLGTGIAMLGACGGGGGGSGTEPPATNTYIIGGSVSGLVGVVELRNNRTEPISVSADGAFSFSTPVSSYAVTVLAQPAGQICSVTNDTGTATAAVVDVAVTCVAAQAFAIGGAVNGLAGAVVLQNNGEDDRSVAVSGSFSFTTPVSSYYVSVLSQPIGQTCSVSNGSGTAAAAVANVVVNCAASPVLSFTIGGTVSGLTGSVVLRNNATDDLTVTASGPFDFTAPSSAYAVTVLRQPVGQVCSVGKGNGTASAAVSDVTLSCVNLSGSLTLFAGNLGGPGNGDGNGAAAAFNGPQGVAIDSAGNVYVADGGNQTIRKITPAGEVTTFAGSAGVSGSADGMGGAARFSNSQGLATDSAGNVFVADRGNHTIRRITPAGAVTTIAGSAGVSGSVDGVGAAALFNLPTGVTADNSGNVYVADSGNHTIRRITPAGVVTTFAGSAGSSGTADGSGLAARFDNPYGVAADSAGNLFVSDSNNHTIRRITPAGMVTTFAGSASATGSIDGVGSAAQFGRPAGVSTDSGDNVYVTEFESYVIRRITPAAVVTTLAGAVGLNGTADGTGAAARFYRPFGVATDIAGNAYIADTGNSMIRRISPAGAVTTLAGSVAVGGNADGTGTAAQFFGASGVTTDSAGNVYVADQLDHAIRRITPSGVVTAFAGSSGSSGGVDGAAAAALFSAPVGLATDGADNVYVADRANHAIRRITPAGVVTTIAGLMGAPGSADAAGTAARFQFPEGVAVDAAGNVYVADTGNHTIRKIDPTGVVTTLAGLAGDAAFADGTTAARFNAPVGIATNSVGDVFVTDGSNTMRRITPAGVVTVFAGLAQNPGTADGTSAAARFDRPGYLGTDSAGNFYVVDRNNNAIRKVTPVGLVATIVGVAGQSGFAPGALPGRLSTPVGVTVRGTVMYITMPTGVAVVQGLQ